MYTDSCMYGYDSCVKYRHRWQKTSQYNGVCVLSYPVRNRQKKKKDRIALILRMHFGTCKQNTACGTFSSNSGLKSSLHDLITRKRVSITTSPCYLADKHTPHTALPITTSNHPMPLHYRTAATPYTAASANATVLSSKEDLPRDDSCNNYRYCYKLYLLSCFSHSYLFIQCIILMFMTMAKWTNIIAYRNYKNDHCL